MESLHAIIDREFTVVRERVGEIDLWMRAEPRQHHWDLEMVRPILEGDEYELLPILQAGHRISSVVDVGAHVGGFTLRVKSLWPEATVVALEADPETAEVYRRNVANLSGIQFHALAAVRPGVEQLRFCQMGRGDGNGHTGASFATEVVRRLDPSFSAGAPICVVPAAPLSRILEAAGIPQIDILKLDCEGAEPEILHDLKNAGWLRKTRWIRGEWHHVASISLIQEALQETHTYHIGVNPHPWGAFIAHRSE